ncbi:MAG TPA: hypothetical protein VJN44_01300, partial [Roseateles sp.]|nr:hypothetical protein [Roseateles sp.]
TGESNELRRHGRGIFLVLATGAGAPALAAAVAGALLAGNGVALLVDERGEAPAQTLLAALPASAPVRIAGRADAQLGAWLATTELAGVVVAGEGEVALSRALQRRLAERPGAILPLIEAAEALDPRQLYRFAAEQTLTINTAAAGGNAALLAGLH